MQKDDNGHEAADEHTHIQNMLLLEIQGEDPAAAQQKNQRQDNGNGKADALADTGLTAGLFLFPGTETLPGQGDGRHLHPISEGKAETEKIHTDIMGGKLIRTETRGDERSGQETDAHSQILDGAGEGQVPDGKNSMFRKAQLQADHQRNTHIAGTAEEGRHCHAGGDYSAQDSGDRRASDAPGGETETPLDQQPVKNDIHDTGNEIRAHGEAGIAAAALGRVDDHGDDVEEHAAHDDPEIFHGGLMGIFIAAGKAHHLRREDNKKHREQRTEPDREPQGGEGDFIGIGLIPLSLASGNEGGYRDIDAEKDSQPDELRLSRQPRGRYGIGTELSHHHRVNHAGEHNKKAFHHSRPGNGERLAGHALAGRQGFGHRAILLQRICARGSISYF